MKFAWLIALVLVFTAAGLGLWILLTRQDAAFARWQREHAAFAARADEQHAQILAGDNRGIYGDYRPEIYPTG